MKRKAVEGLLGVTILMATLTGCSKADVKTQNAKAKENGITRELPPENQIAPEDVIEKPSWEAGEGKSDALCAFEYHVQNAYYNEYLMQKEMLENGRTEKAYNYTSASGQSWDYIYTAFENRGVPKDIAKGWVRAATQNGALSRQESVESVSKIWQEKDMDSRENTNVIGVKKMDNSNER